MDQPTLWFILCTLQRKERSNLNPNPNQYHQLPSGGPHPKCREEKSSHHQLFRVTPTNPRRPHMRLNIGRCNQLKLKQTHPHTNLFKNHRFIISTHHNNHAFKIQKLNVSFHVSHHHPKPPPPSCHPKRPQTSGATCPKKSTTPPKASRTPNPTSKRRTANSLPNPFYR